MTNWQVNIVRSRKNERDDLNKIEKYLIKWRRKIEINPSGYVNFDFYFEINIKILISKLNNEGQAKNTTIVFKTIK